MALGAVLAPLISGWGPEEIDFASFLAPPSPSHPLGTDGNGMDLWSRVLFAARIDVGISLAAVAVEVVSGSLIGGLVGYIGGWVDEIAMRLAGGAYVALLQRRDRLGEPLHIASNEVHETLARETRIALDLRRLRHNLFGHHGNGSLLLDDALAARDTETIHRLVALLDMLHAEIVYDRVGEALFSSDRRRRASTVELIDNVINQRQREQLLPLFDQDARTHEPQSGLGDSAPASLPEQLRALARGDDRWLRACVLFRIGGSRLDACIDVIDTGLIDADARVRETAQFALRAVLSSDELQRRLHGLMTGGDYARSNPYAAQMHQTLERGESAMALSQLEKVFFLKSVLLFEHIPGEEIVASFPSCRKSRSSPETRSSGAATRATACTSSWRVKLWSVWRAALSAR